jgi:hypothetical protein
MDMDTADLQITGFGERKLVFGDGPATKRLDLCRFLVNRNPEAPVLRFSISQLLSSVESAHLAPFSDQL